MSDRVHVSLVEAGPSDPVLLSRNGLQLDDLKFRVYKPESVGSGRAKRKRIFRMETERVIDEAKTFDLPPTRAPQCQYLLGVFSPDTNTLQLRPVQQLPVHQHIKGIRAAKPAEPAQQNQYLAEKNLLGHTFGSKRTISDIRSRERNQVDSQVLAGISERIIETVDTKVSGMKALRDIKVDADATRPVPPFDASATEPMEIYKLSTLVPAEVCAEIDPEEWRAEMEGEDCPAVGAQCYARFWTGERRNEELARYAVLHACMVRFLRYFERPCMRYEALATGLAFPDATLEYMMREFTEERTGHAGHAKWVMSVWLKSRLICYICVLSLHLMDNLVDPSVLVSDLRMAKAKVATVFKSLGCRSKSRKSGATEASADGSVTGYSLVAPLRFPEMRKIVSKK